MNRNPDRELARKSMESLPDSERVALLLREDGLNYDEIADALNITRDSVGATLARARRRIAEHFERLERQLGAV